MGRYKVILDDGEKDGDSYILVDTESGKCMYLCPELGFEQELRTWNSDHVNRDDAAGKCPDNYTSIYALIRYIRSPPAPMKLRLAHVLLEGDTFKEAFEGLKLWELLNG